MGREKAATISLHALVHPGRSPMPRTIQRRSWLLSFLVWSCASPLFAQPASIDSTLDHEVLVKRLRNAKDLQYRDALWHYQAYLTEHPADVRIHLERCAC